MTIFISVVSHNHKSMIRDLGSIEKLSKEANVQVIIKNNTNESFSDFCRHNIYVVDSCKGSGFAKNNNLNFAFAINELKAKNDDYFIAVNPDVIISYEDIMHLVESMRNDQCVFSTVNLYKNADMTVSDDSIRNFPAFKDFLGSFLGFKNKTCLDKMSINEPCEIEWCSGALMAFKVSYYKELGGFDERYFMYCEDIDICHRSFINGVKVKYYPNVKAIHLAQHKNKKIYSRHFYWHVKSTIRFLCKTKFSQPRTIHTERRI